MSFHTKQSLQGFIHTELIRYIRISSSEKDFLDIRNAFCERLRQRGYPLAFILKAFEKADYGKRDSYLIPIPNPNRNRAIPLLYKTRMSPLHASCKVRRLLRVVNTLCSMNPTLQKIFPNRPIVCLKRSANIADYINTHYKRNQSLPPLPLEEYKTKHRITDYFQRV
jgi:hypothetical protein